MRKFKDFSKPSFIVAVSMFLFMEFFVLIGNPKIISGNAMCWHHIPELVGVYFVGVWMYEIKKKFKYVFLIYIFAVLINSALLGMFTNFAFVLGAIIASPLLLGYYVKKEGRTK